jgi:arylsulfatase A-like enzyme
MLYAMWASSFVARRHEFSPEIWVVCLVAVLAVGCSCHESNVGTERDAVQIGAGDRPNVLLITVDTLRRDRLSCYGYEKHETPNIDRLAGSGALFERAFCDVTWTTPSRASVMTGTYATIHGFKTTDIHSLNDRNITLAEVLREHGYTTAAVIGSFPLNSIYGLDQGFDVYDDLLDASSVGGSDRQVAPVPSRRSEDVKEQNADNPPMIPSSAVRLDPEVTKIAAQWLRRSSGRPFFLWVHYLGPHSRPTPRLKSAAEHMRRHVKRYDSKLRVNDREVGRLLEVVEELGLTTSTLIVFHADHGESLQEHGSVGHEDLYEPTLGVPLIVSFPPRVPAGIRVRSLARNIDIFPTVLEAVGIEVAHSLSGDSLFPLMAVAGTAADVESPRETYMETYLPAHRMFAPRVRLPDGSLTNVGVVSRGIRTHRWKFATNEPIPFVGESSLPDVPKEVLASLRTEELYDLDSDPEESENVIAQHPALASTLRAKLASYARPAAVDDAVSEIELDEAAKERLRALGYME